MSKRIWKFVDKKPVLVLEISDSIINIEEELFKKLKKPEYYPSYIYIYSNKNKDYFIQLLLDVLSSQQRNLLYDEVYSSKLYQNIKKNFKNLSKEEYDNAIKYIDNPSEENKNIILNQKEITSSESLLSLSDIEDLSDDEESISSNEENIEEESPLIKLLRFSCKLGKIYENPDLEQIYDKILIDKDFLLAKTIKGKEPEFVNFEISPKTTSKINYFLYSEHKKNKVFKKLISGQIRLLFYEETDDLKIECTIADTGFVTFKIETDKITYNNFLQKSVKITDIINKISNTLQNKIINDITFTDFFIKVVYPISYGFIPKKTVSLAEKTNIKNDKVLIEDLSTYYSNKDYKITFTVKKTLDNLEQILDLVEKIYKRVDYYQKNFTVIEKYLMHNEHILDGKKYIKVEIKTKYLHNAKNDFKYLKLGNSIYKILEFTDYYITILVEDFEKVKNYTTYLFSSVGKKKLLKDMRRIGLVINAKECEKKRRPILLDENDKSTGENILELNGRKFKCLPPYNYHGIVGKSNCCFINKQSVKQNENLYQTIDTNKKLIITKNLPIKTYNFKSKFQLRTLPENLQDYIPSNFSLLNVAENISDRTIETCLKVVYGENIINESINNISTSNYSILQRSENLESWKLNPVKSLEDILVSVSLYKSVNIYLLIDDELEGLKIFCKGIGTYVNNLILYKSIETKEAYYVVIKKEKDDIVYQHNSASIYDLTSITNQVCNIGFSESLNTYTDILKAQITDFQGLVVFIEITSGGYIPITPSTLNLNFDNYSISSSRFKLQSPENQYKSLKEVSLTYKNLEPIGLTTIENSDIVTGIKLKNGQISPVYQTTWKDSPLDYVEDLFYIEKYSTYIEEFKEQEDTFKKNLKLIKDSITDNQKKEINNYIENEEYNNIIDIVKTFNISEIDDISRITWYLINNQTIF